MSILTSVTPKMKVFNHHVEKCMPFLTPLGVVAGLILGKHISWMKPAVNYLFGFLTFTGALTIGLKDFGRTLKKPKYLLCFALCSFIIMPIMTIILASVIFPNSPEIVSGYALIRAIPTAVVGTIWTSIFSGNMAIAITIIVLDTILAPFITPFMLKLLTHASIPLDTLGMMKSLCIMVVIPSILGMLCNQYKKGAVNKEIGPCLKPFSKLCLVFVIMINCSQVSSRLINNASWQYVSIGLVSLAIALLGYVVGYFGSKIFSFNRNDSVALTFAVAMRNVSAALVLAINYLPPAAALPVIFGIVFQQSSCAVVGNIIFSKKKDFPQKEQQVVCKPV